MPSFVPIKKASSCCGGISLVCMGGDSSTSLKEWEATLPAAARNSLEGSLGVLAGRKLYFDPVLGHPPGTGVSNIVT